VAEEKREVEVLVQIPTAEMSEDQLKHLHEAEVQLSMAGVSFDTGMDLGSRIRDWEFDWSLKGAKVYFKRLKETEAKEEE